MSNFNHNSHGFTDTIGNNVIMILFNSKLIEEKETWKDLFSRLGPSWIPDTTSPLNRTILIMNLQRQIEAVWECDVLINIATLHYVFIANLSIDMIQNHVNILLTYLVKTTKFASYEVINQIGFKVFVYISQNYIVGLPYFTMKRITKKTVLDHILPMEYQELCRKLHFDPNFNLIPKQKMSTNPFLNNSNKVPSDGFNTSLNPFTFPKFIPQGQPNLFMSPVASSVPSIPQPNPQPNPFNPQPNPFNPQPNPFNPQPNKPNSFSQPQSMFTTM